MTEDRPIAERRRLENTIDRKLYQVALASDRSKYSTAELLARYIEEQEYEAFGYWRDEELQHSDWPTIQDYVLFAQQIGLLDDTLESTVDKSRLLLFDVFQRWLADRVMIFNQEHGMDTETLRTAVVSLVDEDRRLPTTRDLFSKIEVTDDVSLRVFGWALTLQSVLRPGTLSVCRRWLWLPEGSFDYSKT